MIDKVFFDITQRCNGNCIYCFTNSVNSKKDINTEISVEEIIKTIKELNKINIKKVSFGGGEPFLKDIVKIIENSPDDTKISITTNGSILNDDILDTLKKYENVKLTISLDTLNQETSNKIRKNLDVNKIIKNILKIMREEELKDRLSIRTTVSSYNYKDVFDIIEFCNNNEISNLKINSTNEFGRAKENIEVILDFKEFMNLLDNIIIYCKKNNIYTNVELPIEKYLTNEMSCLCGNTSIYIDWDGNVGPCAFTEQKLIWGNIRNQSIEEILNQNIDFEHKNSICQKCLINRYKSYEKKTKIKSR